MAIDNHAMTLEIIVTDADEAATAAHAGATQLELVAERGRGGFTPAPEMIERVCACVTVPVHVIVRPHDNGFIYSESDRATMVAEARRAAELGASAIVVGGLDASGNIDFELIAAVRAASALPMTFHRAFDEARDLIAAYDVLTRAPGVTRVLTSGAAPSAWEGREILRELVARNGPSVLAGGRITLDNVADVVRATGVREVHVGSGARVHDRLHPLTIARIAKALSAGASGSDRASAATPIS